MCRSMARTTIGSKLSRWEMVSNHMWQVKRRAWGNGHVKKLSGEGTSIYGKSWKFVNLNALCPEMQRRQCRG